MLLVPTNPLPFQELTVSLNNQACQITLRQEVHGLFMDLAVNNFPIILGVICQNTNPIVRNKYLGFLGDFVFLDSQGAADPDYTGLGTRFSLFYIPVEELPAGFD